ncbi:MAG: hypothetical protein KatS3mg056_1783 [Chloroflexus sp.]|nr:MAG: hypothetical protein KatS3mg056_1783 [Chloroflexus sp.]
MNSILLVDDHAVLRAGLRLLLDGQPDLRVIGEAEDVRTAVAQATALQPDLILLDLSLTGSSGLAAIPALRAVAPHSRILVLTMHDDEGYVRQALAAGANGYVLKRAADAELIAAIRAVLRGELYIHPALTRQLLEDLLPQTPASESLGKSERARTRSSLAGRPWLHRRRDCRTIEPQPQNGRNLSHPRHGETWPALAGRAGAVRTQP